MDLSVNLKIKVIYFFTLPGHFLKRTFVHSFLGLYISWLLSMQLVALPLANHHKLNGSLQKGHLQGVIKDSYGSVIPKAKVTIEGNSIKQTVLTNEEGEYSIDLPVGIYEIKASRYGFCPMNRAAFKLEIDQVNINVNLIECAISWQIIDEGQGRSYDRDSYEFPFKEDIFEIGSASPERLKLMIQYGSKLSSENKIEYKGFNLSGGRVWGVMLSFNLLTIRADKISFDKTEKKLEAEGNITLDDNGREKVVERLLLTFENSKPFITVLG